MVTVMVVPNGLAAAVIINEEEIANGPRVRFPTWPSCVVPLTVTVWSPTATEGNTKPSVPVTVGIRKDRTIGNSKECLHDTNG